MQDNTQLTITTQETVSIFNGLTVSIIISDQGKMYVPIRQLAGRFTTDVDKSAYLASRKLRVEQRL